MFHRLCRLSGLSFYRFFFALIQSPTIEWYTTTTRRKWIYNFLPFANVIHRKGIHYANNKTKVQWTFRYTKVLFFDQMKFVWRKMHVLARWHWSFGNTFHPKPIIVICHCIKDFVVRVCWIIFLILCGPWTSNKFSQLTRKIERMNVSLKLIIHRMKLIKRAIRRANKNNKKIKNCF